VCVVFEVGAVEMITHDDDDDDADDTQGRDRKYYNH